MAFNRTAYGIEIHLTGRSITCTHTFNRTAYGIEMVQLMIRLLLMCSFNRTAYGIEIYSPASASSPAFLF